MFVAEIISTNLGEDNPVWQVNISTNFYLQELVEICTIVWPLFYRRTPFTANKSLDTIGAGTYFDNPPLYRRVVLNRRMRLMRGLYGRVLKQHFPALVIAEYFKLLI